MVDLPEPEGPEMTMGLCFCAAGSERQRLRHQGPGVVAGNMDL